MALDIVRIGWRVAQNFAGNAHAKFPVWMWWTMTKRQISGKGKFNWHTICKFYLKLFTLIGRFVLEISSQKNYWTMIQIWVNQGPRLVVSEPGAHFFVCCMFHVISIMHSFWKSPAPMLMVELLHVLKIAPGRLWKSWRNTIQNTMPLIFVIIAP